MQRSGSIAWAVALLGLLATTPALAKPTLQCGANGQAALAALTQGKFELATKHFAPETSSQVSPAMLQSIWKQLSSQMGAFETLGQLQPQQVAGHDLLVIALTFANGKLAALVDCDADNRITTFRLVPASALPAAAPDAADTKGAPETDHVMGVVSRAVNVPSPLGPLPGILDLPEGAGPFPAVVFAGGSGPNDADETIGPNKPFRDIAIGLAKAGIASLRFDKRAHVYGAEMAGKPITLDDEETDDVLNAITVLAEQAHIDPDRLFVVGHSEGAMLAPRIARKSGQLAGIVMLAAPARPLLDVMAGQIRYLGKLQDAPAAQIAAQEQAIDAERKLLAKADPAHSPKGEFFRAPQSFWLGLHDYHQVAVAQSLTLPMLVLQGGHDYQVSPTLDFGAWKKALAGKPNVTFHLFPGLSHLFMPGSTRSPEDYEKPAHVEPAVIDLIAKWVKAQPSLQ